MRLVYPKAYSIPRRAVADSVPSPKLPFRRGVLMSRGDWIRTNDLLNPIQAITRPNRNSIHDLWKHWFLFAPLFAPVTANPATRPFTKPSLGRCWVCRLKTAPNSPACSWGLATSRRDETEMALGRV